MNINHSMMFKASTLILLIGVLGDEITTLLGISSGKFIESNPLTNQLINNGSWILVDLITILICVSIPFIIIRKSDNQNWAFSILPLLPGLIRLSAFISNLILITSV